MASLKDINKNDILAKVSAINIDINIADTDIARYEISLIILFLFSISISLIFNRNVQICHAVNVT